MILSGGRFQVFVATTPVDFRKGIEGLAAVAQQQLRLDPFCGAVLVFRAKRADRVKLLVWDGSGLTLIDKRLDEGKFCPPPSFDGVRFAKRIDALFCRKLTSTSVRPCAWII